MAGKLGMGTGVGVARTALRGGGVVVWLTTGGAELQLAARSTAAPTNVNTMARRMADRERTELITSVYRAVEAKSYVGDNAQVMQLGTFSYSKARERKEMLTWTVDEIERFETFAHTCREFAMYHTTLATGMRRGEVLGLRRRDLDLEASRLRVRQQWTKDGDGGRRFITLKTGTKAWRTIDLDDLTVEVLRRHLANQEFERRARGEKYRRDLDLVFCKWDGVPYDPDETTRRFEARAAACPGVLGIRFHDMRHTHATLLLESGESIKYVAERLGDREDTVLETYAHVTAKMRFSGVGKVRGFFGAAGVLVGVDAEVAMPRVQTGSDDARDPYVTPTASEKAHEGRGGA